MDRGLPVEAFSDRIYEVIASADHDWIIDARGAEGVRPVGIILATALANGRAIEPFVQWFPWASNRNQLEGAAAFLKYVSGRLKIFVFAEESAADFWNRLIRYGLIRRGCKVIDHFSRGEHAMMYYTQGPD